MQRRAAVAYIAFFLVIAAGAYTFIAIADEPAVTLSGDNVQSLQENDTFTVGDREYTVRQVSAETGGDGGGHGGGGGGISYTVEFAWTNESAQFSETWDQNSTVEYENQTYRVFANGESGDVVLRWEPGDQYAPTWSEGIQFVDGNRDEPGRQDVRVSDFIANSDNESIGYVNFTEGDTISYNGNETTVANVSQNGVVLEWTAPRTETVSASNNQNVTLNEQPYAVHFENNDTVLLGQGNESQQQLHEAIEDQERFHGRINGVWGVIIGSVTTSLLLVSLAFLPRKD